MKKTSCPSILLLLLSLAFFAGCYFPPDDPVSPTDDIAPSVTIVAPPNGTIVGGQVLIRALATDNEGIQKVVLYVDGLPTQWEAYSEPYELHWDTWSYTDLVPHVITVRAYDYSFNMADSDPVTYFLDKGSVYPKPVSIREILYADSAYSISWTLSKDPYFESYVLYESMLPDLSDEHEVFSTHLASDTTFVVTMVPPDDHRYFRVKITNEAGYEAFSEVMPAYSPGTPPPLPTEGLMAYFPFNGNATDESGNGHNGIPQGVVLTADRHGNADQAYDFSIEQGSIVVSNAFDFSNLESFTIAAWIYHKYPSASSIQSIVSKVSPQRDFVLQLGPQGQPTCHFAYDPGIYYACWATDPAPVGKWVHLAAAWTGVAWKLYVDGELINTQSFPGMQPPWTSEDLTIGALGSGEIFQGCIDEVLIYNRELTEQEIMDLAYL